MEGSISHVGIVESVAGNKAFVRIEQLSACAQCQAASMCNASDKKDKIIEATLRNGQTVSKGDCVKVVSDKKHKPEAVFLAYILPLFIMVAVLFVLYYAGYSEAVSALFSLAAIAVYFLCLLLFKNKLKKRFAFYIETE